MASLVNWYENFDVARWLLSIGQAAHLSYTTWNVTKCWRL